MIGDNVLQTAAKAIMATLIFNTLRVDKNQTEDEALEHAVRIADRIYRNVGG